MTGRLLTLLEVAQHPAWGSSLILGEPFDALLGPYCRSVSSLHCPRVDQRTQVRSKERVSRVSGGYGAAGTNGTGLGDPASAPLLCPNPASLLPCRLGVVQPAELDVSGS